MANYLGIATVTATLQQLLADAIQQIPHLSNVPQVRTGRPQQPAPSFVGINLYLYRVAPNPFQRSADLPSRNGNGAFIQPPQAALDLHYLLSFYGDSFQQEPERLLGKTVAALNTVSVLTPDRIRGVIRAAGSNSYLADSDLPNQTPPARLVITPITLSLEELSKLWTVFFQTTHVLSMAYQVSIVNIDANVQITPAPLVQQVDIDVNDEHMVAR